MAVVGSSNWKNIKLINNTYYVVGDGSYMTTSQNGTTWETPTQILDYNGNAVIWYAITNNGSRFVMVGQLQGYGTGRIAYSNNGENWTVIHNEILGFTPNPLLDVIYANGKFVAVGNYGQVCTSSDGITWDYRSVTTRNLKAVTYGNGKHVAVGDYLTIAYSDNADYWATSQIYGTIETIYGITYGGGQFVAVGENHPYTSPDGIQWTTAVAYDGTLNDVLYSNGKYIGAGNFGQYGISDDGVNWTFAQIKDENGVDSTKYFQSLVVI